MKIFLVKFMALMKSLQLALITFGGPGIFVIALMDAAFIPLPGGPDAVVISLSHHNHAMMPLYLAAAVVGSTIGSLFLYWVARRGGAAALRKFSAEKRERVQRMLDKYDVWALLLASVLPPPFPFKLFVLSAGAFRMQMGRFIFALVVGRGFRFLLEGLLAVRYGDQATELFKQHYPKIGLGIAAVIIAVFTFNVLLRRRQAGGFEPTSAD